MEFPLAQAMSADRVSYNYALLKKQLEMAEEYLSHISHLESCASTQVMQLKGAEKEAAQKEYEILTEELAKAEKTVLDLTVRVRAMTKPSALRGVAPQHKTWHVSDMSDYCSSGAWALEAVSSGSYAMSFAAFGWRERLYGRKYHGGPETDASSLIRMSIGDTVFMADTKRGKVFQGIVKSKALKGEQGLHTIRGDEAISFRRRVDALETALGASSPMRPLKGELEYQIQIDWTEVPEAKLEDYAMSVWQRVKEYRDLSLCIECYREEGTMPDPGDNKMLVCMTCHAKILLEKE
jgi:hypothetical protein